MTDGINRAGPPQAMQKLRENFYLVQVPLSETPSADWKRLVLRRAAVAARRNFRRARWRSAGTCCAFVPMPQRRAENRLDRSLDRTRQSEGGGHGRAPGRGAAPASRRVAARTSRTGGPERPLGETCRIAQLRFLNRAEIRSMATTTKQDYYELLGVRAQGGPKGNSPGLPQAGPQVSSGPESRRQILGRKVQAGSGSLRRPVRCEKAPDVRSVRL